MTYDRTADIDTIQRMVQTIEPTWQVTDATPATGGHHVVYLLTVDTETGPRGCVLKATPPGKSPTVDVEARMLAILAAHTTVPVPAVYGVVDEYADHGAASPPQVEASPGPSSLPTPFFLAARSPGEDHGRTEVGAFTVVELERLARSCGRHLAGLHELDAVDGYGYLAVEYDRPLSGECPSPDPAQLVVEEPTDSWAACLRESAEGIVAGLAETRFADVAETVEPALDAAIGDLVGPFRPVVCRVDNSLDNLLVDPDTSETTAFLDWEFQFAGTPAYDLAFVEHSLAGGVWTFAPDVPDRTEAVRRGLLAGYREVGPARVVEQFEANRDCYALLACCHAMLNFDDFFDQVDATDEQRASAVDPLRAAVESLCEER